MIINVKNDSMNCDCEITLNDVLFCGTRRITYRGEVIIVPEIIAVEFDKLLDLGLYFKYVSIVNGKISKSMDEQYRAKISDNTIVSIYDYISRIGQKNIRIAN